MINISTYQAQNKMIKDDAHEVDVAESLQQLEALGYVFSLAADGQQMTVTLPAGASKDEAERWLGPLKPQREVVRGALAARDAWVEVFEGYADDGDLARWADELARLGTAGAMECHHPGGWPAWREWYRKQILGL